MRKYLKDNNSKTLSVLFLTELWERYGFYTIQSLIALYLSFQLGLSDTLIYSLVGGFTASTYISPLMGGWIADNLIGQRKTILLGALVLMGSYIALAFSNTLKDVIFSLATVAVGTGLLKPNISSILGKQYAVGDSKRNTGFTIFYIGINLGILLGTTLPTFIRIHFNWRICFLSAAFGLFISFFIFLIGYMKLDMPEYASFDNNKNSFRNYFVSLAILVTFLFIFYFVLIDSKLSYLFFIAIIIGSVFYILSITYREKGLQKYKTFAYFLLCIISVIFWSLYFEMFMALTFFIHRTVQPMFLGIVFPPPYYVAIQSIGVIVFGFFLQKYWAKRKSASNLAYSATIKFTISIFLMMIAYGIIVLSIGNPHSTALISPWLIIIAYLIISLAELMLSPIGLAAVTDLVRPQIVSTMMGIFFVTLGLGGYFSGKLANIAALNQSVHDITVIKSIYYVSFIKLTGFLFCAFILSMTVVLIVRRLLGTTRNSTLTPYFSPNIYLEHTNEI